MTSQKCQFKLDKKMSKMGVFLPKFLVKRKRNSSNDTNQSM